MTHRIGVDLGGTKTSIAVLDTENRMVFSKRAATPSSEYRKIVSTIAALFKEAGDHVPDAPVEKIGVGIPGAPEHDDQIVKNANTQVLIGKPLKRDLEEALGVQVAIANDASCFAISEAADGAAKDGRVVFGVILGTGVGGGIVVDGKPWLGGNRLAGEWGHNPFPYFGAPPGNRKCYCGKIDCIERILSGPALAETYFEVAGEHLMAMEIADAAEAGSRTAGQVIRDYAENLAKALSTVINILDPDVIVLGGGLSNIDSLYELTPQFWGKYVFNASARPAAVSTRLLRNKWGDDSGVRGAAWLT